MGREGGLQMRSEMYSDEFSCFRNALAMYYSVCVCVCVRAGARVYVFVCVHICTHAPIPNQNMSAIINFFFLFFTASERCSKKC